ncbi:MAG: hypothetical protein WC246_00655 [Candidatus Paceibacterota bacterium]|jgi:hypothetical protein
MFFSKKNKIFFTRRITHTVNLKRERQLMMAWRIGLASLCGMVLVSVVGYSFWGHADVALQYPSSCLGSWLNVSNAAGKPDLSSDASSLSFNGVNSAVLLGGAGAGDKQIFCSGFNEADQRASSTAVSAQLSLSWTIAGKDQLNPDMPAPAQGTATDTASSSIENQTVPSSTDASSTSSDASTSTPTNTDTAPVPTETSTPPAPAALLTPKASSISLLWHAISDSLLAPGARAQEGTTPPPEIVPPPAPATIPDTATPPPDVTASPAPDTTPAPAPVPDASSSVPTDQSVVTSTDVASSTASDTVASSSDVLTDASASTSSDSVPSSSSSPSISASSSETTTPAQPLPSLFEVRYSFDGSVWDVAGRVTQADFGASFPIPLPSHVDLSHLQIAIVPVDVSSLTDNQAVYLDGMTLAVSYQDEKKVDGHRSRISFSSDQVAFSPDEIADTAFNTAGQGTPCIATPFSQKIMPGEQAAYAITIPNEGTQFVAKLGDYPQDMEPIFMPVSANDITGNSLGGGASTTAASSTADTSTSTATDTVAASSSSDSISTATDSTTATATLDAPSSMATVIGQTMLIIKTTASTTPGSYTLVVLYGSKDADKNVSTGLCQVNLIVR